MSTETATATCIKTDIDIDVDSVPIIKLYEHTGDVEITTGKVISGRITKINGLLLDTLQLNDNDYLELFQSINIKQITVTSGGEEGCVSTMNKYFDFIYINDIPDGNLGIQVVSATGNVTVGSSSSRGSDTSCGGLKVIKVTKNHTECIVPSGIHMRIGDVIVTVNGVAIKSLSTKAAVSVLTSSTHRKLLVLRKKHDNNSSSSSTSSSSISYDRNQRNDAQQKDIDTDGDGDAAVTTEDSRHIWEKMKRRYFSRVYATHKQMKLDLDNDYT